MILVVQIGTKTYRAETRKPLDISIPLDFHAEQPNVYGVPQARADVLETETFVGDTRRGGSCNVESYTLIPHCNGTHTECVGHIARERISIHRVLQNVLIPCTVVSVQPVKAGDTHEVSRPQPRDGDALLTRAALERALSQSDAAFLEGLVIRTLPNDPSKKARRYAEPAPPYFTVEAMAFIDSLDVQHLLVDIPSVDRTADDGKMTTHHLFWHVPEESHEVEPTAHSLRTITEMVYVPDRVADGVYLLNLQIPGFVSDAAPSRPLLFEIQPVNQTE